MKREKYILLLFILVTSIFVNNIICNNVSDTIVIEQVEDNQEFSDDKLETDECYNIITEIKNVNSFSETIFFSCLYYKISNISFSIWQPPQ